MSIQYINRCSFCHQWSSSLLFGTSQPLVSGLLVSEQSFHISSFMYAHGCLSTGPWPRAFNLLTLEKPSSLTLQHGEGWYNKVFKKSGETLNSKWYFFGRNIIESLNGLMRMKMMWIVWNYSTRISTDLGADSETGLWLNFLQHYLQGLFCF